MAFQTETIGVVGDVVALRFSGELKANEGEIGYAVQPSCADDACVEFARSLQSKKFMGVVNLSVKLFTFSDLPVAARYYDHALSSFAGLVNKGGTLVAPAQVHMHWRDRVNAMVDISAAVDVPTLFVIEVADADELYDERIDLMLHKFDCSSPHAVIFLQDQRERFVLDDGARSIKRLRSELSMGSLDAIFTSSLPSNVYATITPPMKDDEVAVFLHTVCGAYKCCESERTHVYDKTVRIPEATGFDKRLMEYLDANEAVVDGAAGVKWSVHARSLTFRVCCTYDLAVWTVTVLLETKDKQSAALPPPPPSCGLDVHQLIRDTITLVRNDFQDKNEVFRMLLGDYGEVFAKHPDLKRMCKFVMDKARTEWINASASFDKKSYDVLPIFPRRSVEHPCRQMSKATLY